MKTFSKEEMTKQAAEVFEQYPDVKSVIAITDGNIFLEGKENAAQNHVRSVHGGDAELKKHSFIIEKENVGAAPEKVVEKTIQEQWAEKTVAEVKELIEIINDQDDLIKIKGWVDTKGGKAAIDDRIEALKAESEKVNSDKIEGTEGSEESDKEDSKAPKEETPAE
jgi:hypothetical protein